MADPVNIYDRLAELRRDCPLQGTSGWAVKALAAMREAADTIANLRRSDQELRAIIVARGQDHDRVHDKWQAAQAERDAALARVRDLEAALRESQPLHESQHQHDGGELSCRVCRAKWPCRVARARSLLESRVSSLGEPE